MAKAENKTKATEVSVADYIAALPDEARRAEAAQIDAMFRRVTGFEARMWGPSIIGYGSYDYKYESGREGTSCRAGFSPRKAALTFYGLGSMDADDLFAPLGKYTVGKGCLYIKRLEQVDAGVLEEMVARRWADMNVRHPA